MLINKLIMEEKIIIKGEEFYRRKELLQEVKNDVINWKTYYIDSNTDEKWVQEYSHSNYHGGGEPRLRLLSGFPWEEESV